MNRIKVCVTDNYLSVTVYAPFSQYGIDAKWWPMAGATTADAPECIQGAVEITTVECLTAIRRPGSTNEISFWSSNPNRAYARVDYYISQLRTLLIMDQELSEELDAFIAECTMRIC
jgi:hypothetical protein